MPPKIKVIFILESPPSGGGYFYDPDGRISEVLFRAMMKTVLNFSPKNKDEGLRKFANSGYLLVNPIYTHVDKLPDKEADKLILDNYGNFLKDLKEITKDNGVKIVLIKKNIVSLLEKPLLKDGLNVLNKGLMIPFPLHYHIKTFDEKIKFLLNDN